MQTLTGPEQLAVWKADATDPRPRAASGWPELDGLLRKQSFGPGQFVILGGRMHTRKTAVMANLIVNMLEADVPVGLVGLDESDFMYVSKIASAMYGKSHITMDAVFAQGTPAWASQYVNLTQKFHLTSPDRPSLDDMATWLEMSDIGGERMRVIFIDYLALMERGKYDGGDNKRIPLLAENVKAWAKKHQVCVIALHQVGRTADELARYHGNKPITPEQLMYGGEQAADIILATYRPALDPDGNKSLEEAIADGTDQSEWQAAADRVAAFQQDTMLQLIKNRPGIELNFTGIRLRSIGDSQKMEVVQ